MVNKKLKATLLWIATFPAFLGGFLVGGLVINLVSFVNNWYIGASSDSGYFKVSYWVISSLVSGALAVYWGTKVAPSHRKIVSTVLLILIVVIAVLAYLSNALVEWKDGFIWPLLGSLAAILGAGYVMYSFYEKGDDFNLST